MIINNLNLLTVFALEAIITVGLFMGLIFFSIKKYHGLGGMSVAYAVLLLTLSIIINHSSNEIIMIYQDSFVFDPLSKYGKSFLCLLTIICLLISETYLKKVKMTFEYTFILLFALFGLCLLLSAYDFLAIYLAIELQSLASYVLASMRRDSANSVEAGLKYFILGSFASGLFVFGMSLIYALTGIHDLNHLGLYLSSISFEDETSMIVIFGLLLMFSGLIFKIGGAPFHMWVADVYEGAPSSITIFFMVVPKVALFGLFLRLCHFSFMDASYIWISFFVFSSILSLIFGSLGALSQVKIKRLFAFSSIDNVGYMLIGLASIGREGENALICYLIIYSVGNLLFWSFLLSSHTFSSKKTILTYITDLSGLAKINALLGIVLAVSFLSLAGIPPFAGFFAKMKIIYVAIDADLYLLSFSAIFGSMFSLFFYLRIVKILFWDIRLYYYFTLKLYYLRLKKSVSYIISILFFFLLWYITLDPAMETLCRSVTQCEGEELDTNKEVSENKEQSKGNWVSNLWANPWVKYTCIVGGVILLGFGLAYGYSYADQNDLLPQFLKTAERIHVEKALVDRFVPTRQKLDSAIWLFNKYRYETDSEYIIARVKAGEIIYRNSDDLDLIRRVCRFVQNFEEEGPPMRLDEPKCILFEHVTDLFWSVTSQSLDYLDNLKVYTVYNGNWQSPISFDTYLQSHGIDRSLYFFATYGGPFLETVTFQLNDNSGIVRWTPLGFVHHIQFHKLFKDGFFPAIQSPFWKIRYSES
jgi:NADH-quinone oxidoreductase subunit N